jgi:hypothetical protein
MKMSISQTEYSIENLKNRLSQTEERISVYEDKVDKLKH